MNQKVLEAKKSLYNDVRGLKDPSTLVRIIAPGLDEDTLNKLRALVLLAAEKSRGEGYIDGLRDGEADFEFEPV